MPCNVQGCACKTTEHQLYQNVLRGRCFDCSHDLDSHTFQRRACSGSVGCRCNAEQEDHYMFLENETCKNCHHHIKFHPACNRCPWSEFPRRLAPNTYACGSASCFQNTMTKKVSCRTQVNPDLRVPLDLDSASEQEEKE